MLLENNFLIVSPEPLSIAVRGETFSGTANFKLGVKVLKIINEQYRQIFALLSF